LVKTPVRGRSTAGWIILGIVCTACVACVGITIGDVGRLRIDMTAQESQAELGRPPEHVFYVEVSGTAKRFEVHTYVLSSGSYDSDYLLAFEDNRLLYWGYPHEFARSADPILNEIGQKAVAALRESTSY
jgi:hypothetical protein